jgi:hypothetical protein
MRLRRISQGILVPRLGSVVGGFFPGEKSESRGTITPNFL